MRRSQGGGENCSVRVPKGSKFLVHAIFGFLDLIHDRHCVQLKSWNYGQFSISSTRYWVNPVISEGFVLNTLQHLNQYSLVLVSRVHVQNVKPLISIELSAVYLILFCP